MDAIETPGRSAGSEDLLTGMRLLVVDDNAANRELVRAILSPLGVAVTVAGDGQTGVDAALAAAFDAVLMDLRMPGLDGLTAATMIRDGSGPNQDGLILAFSADVEGSTGDRAASPFDGFVSKPVSVADLVAAMAVFRSEPDA